MPHHGQLFPLPARTPPWEHLASPRAALPPAPTLPRCWMDQQPIPRAKWSPREGALFQASPVSTVYWDFWQGAWEGRKSRLETFLQEVGAAECHDVHPNDALTATYCRKMSSLRPEDNRTCQTDWGHESLWEDSLGARSQAGHAAQRGHVLVFPRVGCGEPFPVLRGCLQVEKRQSPFWANPAPAAS